MSNIVAAVVGGVSGLALLAIIIGFAWFCIHYCKNFTNRSSETGSSDPSALVELSKVGRSLSSAGYDQFGAHGARQFTLEELQHATKRFSESNLIGANTFGLVYNGMLSDGTIVSVKSRAGSPRVQFIDEVRRLSDIRHRNLVTLFGFCQEEGLQLLVFEYLSNGTISSHLYDRGEVSMRPLEFKQRLSMALGAAKGLSHLHSLIPPLIHKDFKTSKVFIDENFVAKVADAGISSLLEKIEEAGSSSRLNKKDVFRDPEIGESGTPTEKSDVYSFGVFLLELLTGKEAQHLVSTESIESLNQWVASHASSNELVDGRLANTFTARGMEDVIRLMQRCLSTAARWRPKMGAISSELDRILEKEMALTRVMGEGTATVTLGSQLFASS